MCKALSASLSGLPFRFLVSHFVEHDIQTALESNGQSLAECGCSGPRLGPSGKAPLGSRSARPSSKRVTQCCPTAKLAPHYLLPVVMYVLRTYVPTCQRPSVLSWISRAVESVGLSAPHACRRVTNHSVAATAEGLPHLQHQCSVSRSVQHV